MTDLSSGIIPIQDKFLQPNYLMALGYREGFIFGRVLRRRACMYKPWPLINADGDVVDIADQSYATGCLRFNDPRNTRNDILYLDKETDQHTAWILHGAIGLKPSQIRMYLRMPEAQDIPGIFPNLDPIIPTAGDNLGYISGLQSPYELPTDFLEVVIPPKVHICAEWYNNDSGDRNHQPVANLMFMTYWFQVLTPQTHPNLIAQIALRHVPAAFFTIGIGTVPLIYGSDFEQSWGAKPLTLEEAGALGGGRGGRFP